MKMLVSEFDIPSMFALMPTHSQRVAKFYEPAFLVKVTCKVVNIVLCKKGLKYIQKCDLKILNELI